MDHKGLRILGLAASLRQVSFHRGILKAAHEVGPQWMSSESFDLGRIPYFNHDIEDEGNPEPVEKLRNKILDFLIEHFMEWGVSRIYGYPADGINGITAALLRHEGPNDLAAV
jgi:hypothetical protein